MIEAKLFAYELLEELRRDLPFLDFVSLALPADEAEACVVAKAEGILAGAEEAAPPTQENSSTWPNPSTRGSAWRQPERRSHI
jgi:nicotinate-nucleotide pyrophosphorylase